MTLTRPANLYRNRSTTSCMHPFPKTKPVIKLHVFSFHWLNRRILRPFSYKRSTTVTIFPAHFCKKMARKAVLSTESPYQSKFSSLHLQVTAVALLLLLTFRPSTGSRHDYNDALRKSILFFEGQRSGMLPPDQRVKWRGDSALHDGATVGVSSTSFLVSLLRKS